MVGALDELDDIDYLSNLLAAARRRLTRLKGTYMATTRPARLKTYLKVADSHRAGVFRGITSAQRTKLKRKSRGVFDMSKVSRLPSLLTDCSRHLYGTRGEMS